MYNIVLCSPKQPVFFRHQLYYIMINIFFESIDDSTIKISQSIGLRCTVNNAAPSVVIVNQL